MGLALFFWVLAAMLPPPPLLLLLTLASLGTSAMLPFSVTGGVTYLRFLALGMDDSVVDVDAVVVVVRGAMFTVASFS